MPDVPSWGAHARDESSLRANPERDLFGFRPSAQRLASSIKALFHAAPDRALVLSVEGPWGCGKSTWIDLLLGELERGATQPAPLEVHYNAWIEEEGSADHWARVADQIGERLYRSLQQGAWGHARRLGSAPSRSGQEATLRVAVGTNRLPHARVSVEVDAGADPRLPWRELAWRISHAVKPKDWDPSLALFADPHSRLRGRGLNGMEATLQISRLLAASLTLPANPMGAAGAATAVLDELARASRQAAELPPPESARFVELLNRLVRRLGPDPAPRGPRLVVVLEDLGRLDDAAFRAAIRSLAWMVRLEGALVILALDQDQALRMLPGPSAPGREDALARLIHLRQPVPRASLSALAPLAEGFLAGTIPESTGPSLRILAQEVVWTWWRNGVQTPRMVKRGLNWLATRLEGASADLSPAGIRAVATLMPWQWGLVSLGELLSNDTFRGFLLGLTEAPDNPLTGTAWRVRSPPVAGDPIQQEAVGSLRLLELANEHAAPADVLRAADHAVVACQRLAQALTALDDLLDPDRERAERLLADIQTTALLTRSRLANDPVEDLRIRLRLSAPRP